MLARGKCVRTRCSVLTDSMVGIQTANHMILTVTPSRKGRPLRVQRLNYEENQAGLPSTIYDKRAMYHVTDA